MPTSRILTRNFPTTEEFADVVACYDAAVRCGLVLEWLEWYTAGILQGLNPHEAAIEACHEWDIA